MGTDLEAGRRERRGLSWGVKGGENETKQEEGKEKQEGGREMSGLGRKQIWGKKKNVGKKKRKQDWRGERGHLTFPPCPSSPPFLHVFIF